MKVIPLFTSAYSFKSILTYDKPKDVAEDGSDSIVKIAEDENLDKIFLVEDNMVGFLEVKKNSTKIPAFFGLRLTFCNDITDKEESSKKTESKFIIFAKNPNGYFRLVKIFSKANADGFLEYPRMSFEALKEFWDEKDLLLCVPFYDSFLYNNLVLGNNCIPDFSFAKPCFFVENNGLYIDRMIYRKVCKYVDSKYDIFQAKSIFYKNRKDFFAWQTYRCIKNDSNLRVPNMNGCSSKEFCIESWKEVKDIGLTYE